MGISHKERDQRDYLIGELYPWGFRRYWPGQLYRPNLQGQGMGRLLLADAVTRSRTAALSVGTAGIFVDAKDHVAAKFYRHYGFTACKEQPLKLYLPMW